jgi:hypothetical protein
LPSILPKQLGAAATSANVGTYQGRRAIEDATKACELHSWKMADGLLALSSAYAESGDFDAAVRWWAKGDELSQPRFECK